MGAWRLVTPEYIANAYKKDSDLQYIYHFDWNADGDIDQSFVIKADPTKITLNDYNNTNQRPYYLPADVALTTEKSYETLTEALETSKDEILIKGDGGELKEANTNKKLTVVSGGKLTISGGTYTGNISTVGTGELTITGGTFSSDPSEYVPSEYDIVKNNDQTYTVSVSSDSEACAQIGKIKYTSLESAVKDVSTGGTAEIELLKTCSGNGIMIETDDRKNITIDLNDHTYTVNANTVGSTGTPTQGFHFERGNTVVIKDGTLKFDNVSSLNLGIQNYCNLTLENVTLDASKDSNCQYVLSSNCGKVELLGSTSIIAYKNDEYGYAFDAMWWPENGYHEGTQVTVNTTGTIKGKVSFGAYGSNNNKKEFSTTLNIENGNFEDYELETYNINDSNTAKTKIAITGGTFSSDPSDYVANGSYAHSNTGKNKWGVSKTNGHNYNKNNGDYYFCICGDSVYIPPYTPPQPTTPPATTDTVTNPDGSTTSTTTQENTDGSTTTTVVDKDSNGNVTGTTETTEKITGNTTTKTETATTVDGAQTVTETTTVKNQDGSTEETKKVTDKDANGNVTGTTETVEKTEGNTTTTKETTTAADGSQTVTESTLVKNEDGSSEEKATITAADGSVTNVTTTTQTDGSATEIKETTEKNDAGNTVDVTETKKINTEGTVTSVKEQSVIGNVADNTSATVNVLKDGEDNVKYSRATVNKTVDEDTTRVKLEGPVVDQIESASGTSNVTITMNVNTDDGDTKYSLKVATKNLQAGNKLYVYKENPETGERTMVNSLLYTVTEDGSVTFNTKQNANFVLVNKTTAAALNKAIKKTLTAAKPSSSVKAGKKIKMALNPNLNMENVKSVKYSTTQSSVAKVSSNGTITAKKAGIVSIKAMITLKNGYIKTVTTKITVKE